MTYYFGSRVNLRIDINKLLDQFPVLTTLMYFPESRFLAVEIPSGASQLQLTRAIQQWEAVMNSVPNRYFLTPDGVMF